MNKNSFLTIAAAALPLFLTGCSAEIDSVVPGGKTTVISASVSEPGWDTRSSVDPATDGLDFIGLLWNPGDQIGVFGTQDNNNVPFTYKGNENARKADFEGQSTGMIQYAYYPYNANGGVNVNAVNGTVPAEQIVDGNKLSGDYKVGKVVAEKDFSEVSFSHLFSIVKLSVSAEGVEALNGENLESVSFSVTHGDKPVGIAGDFTFDLEAAAGGSLNYTLGSAVSAITAKWESAPSLGNSIFGYLSAIPEIKSGDKLSFTLTTDKQIVTFSVNSKVDFKAGYAYNFPLTLKHFADDPNSGWNVEKRQDSQFIEGTFTCASLNVDGLPSIVNSGGPGSDGTKKISEAIAKADWDFFGVSENFEYNNELNSALSDYNAGKYRGSVGAGQIFSTADTDGLNFFWKKDGFSAANETMVAFNDAEGGLTSGANTCIKKGFRHYEVTVAEGVVIDVYITHMNTYSGSGNSDSNAYWKAQMSQLRQLRDYVIEKAKANNRPAIIMGDTNMRYTRHSIVEQFINVINSNGLTVNDPWVDFHRNGYPEFGGKSLMIMSKFWKDEKDKESGWYDTTNDICCADNNRGEVVDKIFYINVPGSDIQIKALSCKNDDSDNFLNKDKGDNKTGISTHEATGIQYEDANFNVLSNQTVTITKRWGLADHFPVVATFKYTKKVSASK